MTQISEVSICNQALSWLGGNLITSLNDESVEAELCSANYANIRDMLLEGHDWSFAITRHVLLPSVDKPAFGYTNQFLLPNVLKVLTPISTDTDSNFTDWSLEGEYILANAEKIYFRAVSSLTPPEQFTRLFAEMLAARLAAEISKPLTHSASLSKEMWQLFSIKQREAVANDGMQSSPQKVNNGKMVNLRSLVG